MCTRSLGELPGSSDDVAGYSAQPVPLIGAAMPCPVPLFPRVSPHWRRRLRLTESGRVLHGERITCLRNIPM